MFNDKYKAFDPQKIIPFRRLSLFLRREPTCFALRVELYPVNRTAVAVLLCLIVADDSGNFGAKSLPTRPDRSITGLGKGVSTDVAPNPSASFQSPERFAESNLCSADDDHPQAGR